MRPTSLYAILLAFSLGASGTALAKGKVVGMPEKKRQLHRFSPEAIPIDEVIRMEEDPDYQAWVRERQEGERKTELALEEARLAREVWEQKQEQNRLEYIRERDNRRRDYSAEWRDIEERKREKRERARNYHRSEREYAEAQHQNEEKLEARRLARLREVYGNDRMPASLDENIPKYPAPLITTPRVNPKKR